MSGFYVGQQDQASKCKSVKLKTHYKFFLKEQLKKYN